MSFSREYPEYPAEKLAPLEIGALFLGHMNGHRHHGREKEKEGCMTNSMKDPLKKCWSCADPITNCADCGSQSVCLTYDEAQDCISALSFFRRKWPDEKGIVKARRAMMKIERKLWKLKSRPNKEKI